MKVNLFDLLLIYETEVKKNVRNKKIILDFEKHKMEYLVDINRKFKITLVMVTHDSYAASFCDKVILLKDGIQFLEIEKNNKSNSTFLKDIYELLKRIGGE